MGVYTFKPDRYSSHTKIINYIKSLADRKLKILDVGCSKGFIGKSLKSNKIEFCGIDYSRKDAKEAKKYYKEIKIMDLDSEKPKYPKNSFDIIIMADIIEHLKDSLGIVRYFMQFLKKGGIMILSTANVANIYVRMKLLFGKFDYEERGIMDKTHLRFFTLKTFRQLAKQSNLKIIKEDFTPIPLPMVSKVFEEGRILNILHKGNYMKTKVFPRLLCFQFILYCKKD
jgi:2-polyprenyl-3-methyl-5-hydroxy-6-metoxy-1,4-benzoquinol methylase|tara:strand:+ start:1169 stop:1849 length:681 start_codon:yes stop_codon:yes gene_type:complete